MSVLLVLLGMLASENEQQYHHPKSVVASDSPTSFDHPHHYTRHDTASHYTVLYNIAQVLLAVMKTDKPRELARPKDDPKLNLNEYTILSRWVKRQVVEPTLGTSGSAFVCAF